MSMGDVTIHTGIAIDGLDETGKCNENWVENQMVCILRYDSMYSDIRCNQYKQYCFSLWIRFWHNCFMDILYIFVIRKNIEGKKKKRYSF